MIAPLHTDLQGAARSGVRTRPFRRPRRIALGAGFALLAIALATLRPVDRGPWLPTEPAVRARAEAGAMHTALRSARPAALEAGWASVPLELRVGEPLAGYGARHPKASTGVDDPLHARALFLRAGAAEAVLVTADVVIIHDLVAQEVTRLCAARGLRPESVFFTATHTHGGPGGWAPHPVEQAVCGRFDADAAPRLAHAMAAAVEAARAAARPAEWTWLDLAAPAHVRNRTVRGGPTDPSLDALAVRQIGSGSTGVFAVYGAHATCRGPRVRRFSADYPGALVRHLEAGGMAFAAFGAGAMGSQSPAGERDDAARAEEIGAALARQVLEGMKSAAWKREAALGAERRDVPLPPFQVRLGRRLRLAGWLAGTLHRPAAPFHLLRLDDRWIAGLPVEFSAMLSAPLRADAARTGARLCVTLFNGDYAGYVLPPDLYDTRAYEGDAVLLGPWAGEYFAGLIRAGIGLDPAGDGPGSGVAARTTLRSVLGHAPPDDLLSQREAINRKQQEIIDLFAPFLKGIAPPPPPAG